jgi:hypothetical protein
MTTYRSPFVSFAGFAKRPQAAAAVNKVPIHKKTKILFIFRVLPEYHCGSNQMKSASSTLFDSRKLPLN